MELNENGENVKTALFLGLVALVSGDTSRVRKWRLSRSDHQERSKKRMSFISLIVSELVKYYAWNVQTAHESGWIWQTSVREYMVSEHWWLTQQFVSLEKEWVLTHLDGPSHWKRCCVRPKKLSFLHLFIQCIVSSSKKYCVHSTDVWIHQNIYAFLMWLGSSMF